MLGTLYHENNYSIIRLFTFEFRSLPTQTLAAFHTAENQSESDGGEDSDEDEEYVQQVILVPGQTDRAGFEELGSLVSHHILDSPDCSLLRRLLLVSEQGVGSLHVGSYVGVAGSLVDGGHELGGVEGWPLQHDGVTIPLRPHHVRLLVVTQWYPHYGCGVEQRLLHTWIFKYHI